MRVYLAGGTAPSPLRNPDFWTLLTADVLMLVVLITTALVLSWVVPLLDPRVQDRTRSEALGAEVSLGVAWMGHLILSFVIVSQLPVARSAHVEFLLLCPIFALLFVIWAFHVTQKRIIRIKDKNVGFWFCWAMFFTVAAMGIILWVTVLQPSAG